MNELIDSYMNGNHSWVREQMKEQGILLSEIVEYYIQTAKPNNGRIILMLRRLEQ